MYNCFKKFYLIFIFLFLIFGFGNICNASPSIPYEIRQQIFTDLQRKEYIEYIYSKLKSGEHELSKQKQQEMMEKNENSKRVQIEYINGFEDQIMRAKAFLDILEYKSGKSNDLIKHYLSKTDASAIQVKIHNNQPLLIINGIIWGIM